MPSRPPRYCRHKARDLAYVRIAGKQIYLGRWDSPESHAAYEIEIEKWRRRQKPERYRQTVADLALNYMKYAPSYYRKHGEPTGQVDNIRAALRLLLERHRCTLLCEFDLPQLTAFRDSLIGKRQRRAKKSNRTLSRQYINKVLRIILRMFRWAAGQGLVAAETAAQLRMVEMLQADRSAAPEAPKVLPACSKQVDAVLPFLAPPVRAMVQLQRLTGMRPGEVTIMRPCDLTLRTDGLMVYRPYRFKVEHLDVDRIVFLGPKAKEILLPWLDRDRESFCFQPIESIAWRNADRRKKRKTRLQPSQCDRRIANPKRKPGERYSTGSYCQAIRRACENAGVSVWTPSQLRKTAATTIRSNHDLETAAAVLGHTDPKTTGRHYAKLDYERAAKVMRKIG